VCLHLRKHPGNPNIIPELFIEVNNGQNMDKKKLPIGYYIKMADTLLTDGINNVHQESGLTRTDWQVLNCIEERDITDRKTICEILSKFSSAATIDNTVSALIERGLIKDDKMLRFTEKGKVVFEASFKKQALFRQKFMRNISEEEYLQLIATLEKIVDNLKTT
jgi:DNA-binding MarR family transcriptional regulator